MQELDALIAIGALLAIGAASPGPSFVMVARTAVAASRMHGMLVALGMGVGGLIFAIAALLGLQALFAAVPVVYVAIKVAGGAYLVYLGLRIWRGASRSLSVDTADVSADASARRAFMAGLATQVSNPKTAIVYGSVFAACLPESPSLAFCAATVSLVFLIETGWYGVVAALLSAGTPRRLYLRYKAYIDRVTGSALIVFGIKLATGTKQ